MSRIGIIALLVVLSACSTNEKSLEDEGEVVQALDGDGDGFLSTEDCNDLDATINPAAEELCDSLDNNCDGQIDEDVTTMYYLDADNDGFGDPEVSEESCEARDRFVANGNDCDDTNAERYPGASEVCDGIDNDCNDIADDNLGTLWYEDADFDGYGNVDVVVSGCQPGVGYTDNALDCDDTMPNINPGAPELCDEVDNNCDGSIDEGVTTTYYEDTDGDGFGHPTQSIEACGFPSGYTLDNTDCDDDQSSVRPNGVETCDELDNDCDGDIDEDVLLSFYPDADFDGYGDPTQEVLACTAPLSHVSDNTDCDDSSSSISPDGVEVCNVVDDNCDGSVDEDFTTAGVYDQIDNCGACGVDCQAQGYLNASAMCDASGSAPVCDFMCDSGFFDANQDASDGCECVFVSSDDVPFDGLDADCDGGDGDHNDAIHVSVTNGDNAQDGSQFLPVASITQGLALAAAEGKSYVLIAEGTYTENVTLPDGVFVYGSMNEDFDTRSPIPTSYLIGNAGSPALTISNVSVGASWNVFSIEGYADSTAGSSAVAVLIEDSTDALEMSGNMIFSGPGQDGADGSSGIDGLDGEVGEDGSFGGTASRTDCTEVYAGGLGGIATCGTQDVSGGDGASNICPEFNALQPTGVDGAGDAPGVGGDGGCDAKLNNSQVGCLCNLANSACYGSGEIGIDGGLGTSGTGGTGSSSTGSWDGSSWVVSIGTDGTTASNGSGGGGGGVGSGAERQNGQWQCGQFHHVGGAGGGGGAGGCGGEGGLGGQGGGSSFAILYVCSSTCTALPMIANNEIQSGDAGAGGSGGDGGLGGLGGEGGLAGDSNDPDPNSTTTAWCNNEGGAGGDGGSGGDGGGAGGGAGGNSFAVYAIGVTPDSAWVSASNDLDAGLAGLGGRGGRGGSASNDGGDGVNGTYDEQNWQ